jgi:hypothetical protein
MPWLNDELAYHRQRIRNAFRKWCKCKNSSSATRFQIDNLRMLYKKEAINFQRIIRKEKWKSFCTNDMNSDLLTTLRYLVKKKKLVRIPPLFL